MLGRVRVSADYTWLLVVVLASVLSLASFSAYFAQDTITAYNDARAHLNMARLVIDNLKPGLAQMGSVWLPLQHLLILPFVWSDTLWQTGIAGSIVSMASYVGCGLVVYLLGAALTGRRDVSLVMAIAFLVNANVLYMQAVPMTELLLLLFFLLTAFCLLRWVQTRDLGWLLATALALVGATLTRYDGWFLLMWTSAVVGVLLLHEVSWRSSPARVWHTLFLNAREAWHTIEGRLLLFMTLASLGVVLWLLWNWIIFDDPLYFSSGPYSAQAQQERIEAAGKLFTAGNWRLSVRAYELAMVANIGWALTAMSVIGLVFASWILPLRSLLVLSLLWSPFFFHVLSLYSGNSILVMPELGVHDPLKPSSAWFNVRYGLMMMPAAAVFGTYWLRSRSWQVAGVIALSATAVFSLATGDVITLIDGTRGTSGLQVGDVAQWLEMHVEPDERILTSTAFNNALAFTTGLPLHQFIHEGTDAYWKAALVNPHTQADWIVMASGDVGDPVYEAMMRDNNPHFLRAFTLVYQGEFTNVFQRQPFVVREGNALSVYGERYPFMAVTIYDLLYREPHEVKPLLKEARARGYSVVRFGVFGEGFSGSLQPAVGMLNEERARNLDRIVAVAAGEDIRLLPVLVDAGEAFGGIRQYVRWRGLPDRTPLARDQFFTHADVQHLYQNFVSKIVGRVNSIHGIAYVDDPTLIGWELIGGPATVKVPRAWIREMAAYVRGLDGRHLIMAPAEIEAADSEIFDGAMVRIDAASLEMSSEAERAVSIDKYLSDWRALPFPVLVLFEGGDWDLASQPDSVKLFLERLRAAPWYGAVIWPEGKVEV